MSRLLGTTAPPHKLWLTTQAQLPGPAWHINPRRELPNKSSQKTPAPNKYNPRKSLLKSRSYSIGVRLKTECELKDSNVPGPAKYNSCQSFKSLYDIHPSWTIQSRRKNANDNRHKKAFPAPNKYWPKKNPKLRRSPAFSMTSRLDYGSPYYSANKSNPGPGSYNIKSTIAQHKYPISIKGRRYVINKSKTPATNHYKVTRSSRPSSARSCTMGFRHKRPKLKIHSTPGPIYHVLKPMGYRPKF